MKKLENTSQPRRIGALVYFWLDIFISLIGSGIFIIHIWIFNLTAGWEYLAPSIADENNNVNNVGYFFYLVSSFFFFVVLLFIFWTVEEEEEAEMEEDSSSRKIVTCPSEASETRQLTWLKSTYVYHS